MDWGSIATVAVGGMVSLAGAVLSWRSARGANETTARVARDQIEAGAFERARATYEGALNRMDGEIARKAGQIRTLERRVSALCRQRTDAGLVPVILEEDP